MARAEGQRLGEWVTLGMVSTGNATLAIVAPYFAGTLAEHWQERLRQDHPMPVQFEEVALEQRTLRCDLHDYDDSEHCLLFCTPSNGGYDVEGRFEDVYEDGRPLLVELRVRLWCGDDEGEDG